MSVHDGQLADEAAFFEYDADLWPLYLRLRTALLARHPELGVEVCRTQISFRADAVLGCVSLPVRRRRDWPQRFLLVTFGLPQPVTHDRIRIATEAAPGRWTHHVCVETEAEIDSELLGWLDAAWDFAAARRGRRKKK